MTSQVDRLRSMAVQKSQISPESLFKNLGEIFFLKGNNLKNGA